MEKNNQESSVLSASLREEKNKKVRGTMTYHTNGDAEFSAQKEGAPSQEVLKKSKTGKLYRTTSKENPKLCAYLSCDADAPDAAQRLEEQLAEFTAGFGGKPKKEPQPLARDRVLPTMCASGTPSRTRPSRSISRLPSPTGRTTNRKPLTK